MCIERKTCIEATCHTATTTKTFITLSIKGKVCINRRGNSTINCQNLIKFFEPSPK